MSNRNRPVQSLKSWLFTPATKSNRFQRASEVHADALIIDLEDAVAPADKDQARHVALQYLDESPADRLAHVLRINAPSTKFGLRDLQALLDSSADPDYVIVPKCDSAACVRLVHTLLGEMGKSAEIIALIESARSIEALHEIATADVKPAALLFGAADMAADLGSATEWEPLLWVRSRIVQAAALSEIPVLDSPFFDITDVDGLTKDTNSAARLGFHGKCAIHPGQITIINEILTPTAAQVAEAKQVLVVNRQGVGSVDHKMVDEAVARRARLILARAGINPGN